jgi:competence protein ComEA
MYGYRVPPTRTIGAPPRYDAATMASDPSGGTGEAPPRQSEPPAEPYAGASWRSPRPSTLLNTALIVLALTAFALLALRSESNPGVEVELRAPPPGVDEILVHVRGAVASPGVVRMEPGERVDDAVRRAGGLLPEADVHALNLALRVRDQDLIHVPRLGETSAGLIDLNTATQRELESLPGIGPARAGAIITARPLASVEDLVERRLVPASVFEQVRMLVTVLGEAR